MPHLGKPEYKRYHTIISSVPLFFLYTYRDIDIRFIDAKHFPASTDPSISARMAFGPLGLLSFIGKLIP
jgi:uncharacterized membrane protein